MEEPRPTACGSFCYTWMQGIAACGKRLVGSTEFTEMNAD